MGITVPSVHPQINTKKVRMSCRSGSLCFTPCNPFSPSIPGGKRDKWEVIDEISKTAAQTFAFQTNQQTSIRNQFVKSKSKFFNTHWSHKNFRLCSDISEMNDTYQVVVIGSGYGGGVAAARFARFFFLNLCVCRCVVNALKIKITKKKTGQVLVFVC